MQPLQKQREKSSSHPSAKPPPPRGRACSLGHGPPPARPPRPPSSFFKEEGRQQQAGRQAHTLGRVGWVLSLILRERRHWDAELPKTPRAGHGARPAQSPAEEARAVFTCSSGNVIPWRSATPALTPVSWAYGTCRIGPLLSRPYATTTTDHSHSSLPPPAAQAGATPRTGWMHSVSTDTRLGVATTLGSAVAAMCVQLVDASGNLAIHMPTRILLRSSSTHEPSDPPLEVVCCQASATPSQQTHTHVGPPLQGASASARVSGFQVE